MSAENQITLVGHLTRTPTLSRTHQGVPVANFGLVVERRWQNARTGEKHSASDFFDVVAWHETASHVVEDLAKDDRVILTGRLKIEPFEDANGVRHTSAQVHVEEIGLSLRFGLAKPPPVRAVAT